MLSAATWRGVDLLDLIRDQLLVEAADETRIDASGPHLEAQLALRLALMLHELGAITIKYVALSTVRGWCGFAGPWRTPCFACTGRNAAVPSHEPWPSRGFGRTLIEQSAKVEGGEALMSIEAQGFVWNIACRCKNIDR